jgi:PAS domain S-box-containing protein
MNGGLKDLMFFFGKSPLGELARSIDWNHHPLGPVETWSLELKTAISIMMGSKFPMFISWGKERFFFYNDSYAVILGKKHPKAFGDLFYNIWSEIWTDIEPLIHSVDKGEAVYLEDLKLIMNRDGQVEETYFTFSYSPLLSQTGRVEGLYCVVVETTDRKKTEDALKSEQMKLKSVFAQAPYPIALLEGPDHRFVFVNTHYKNYFMGGEDQSGKTVEEVIPDAKAQGFIDILDNVYRSGERFIGSEVKFDFTDPSGMNKTFYFNFVYEPIRNNYGQMEGILAVISDITELVESKKKAQESQARLAFALESAQMGIWSVDLMSKEVTHSDASRKVLGIDKNPEVNIHPEDRVRVTERLSSAVASGELYFDEYRIHMPSGETRWIQAHGLRRDQDLNLPSDFIGTVRDITEEKTSRELIKSSEARLQVLAETIPQMAWRTDPNGSVTYFNLNWIKKTGTSLDKNLGHGWLDVLHPEDRDITIERWNLSLRGQAEYNTEYRVKMADGSYRWHMARGVPLIDQTNKIVEWIGTTTDIEDQKRARIEFERSVDVSPAILWITGVDGECSYLSQQWFEFTGQTEEEALGFGWLDVIHPDDSKQTAEIYIKANEAQKPFYAEYRLRTKSGDYRWAIDAGNPRYDQNGKYVGYAGTVFDIHDLKIYEEELREALRARDEFLSIASHELKTPLTSLKIQAQLNQRMLKKNDPSVYAPENVEGIIQQIDKQVHRLTRLVDDMLDVSRIRSGTLKIIPEKFNLRDLVLEVIERLNGQFENNDIPLPTLSLCDNAIGSWDRLRLEQVLSNLLTNAIRYGNKGPIEVTVESMDPNIMLMVKDQGIGISQESQERIFDRFERSVDSNDVSGLGLGLFITKQIVLAHQGKIWVESEIGQGSVFTVELPKNQSVTNEVTHVL